MQSIWNELLEFESRDLLERYCITKFGKKPSAQKIHQIAANFIQAREYFRNAQDSSITVKPLLQYYGVLSLSKGLILAANNKLTEAQLKPAHGLEIKNWGNVIKTANFEYLKITIRQGTFSELLQVTENKNYLRQNSDKVTYKAHLNSPPKGTTIELKQIIQYFPDLSQEYHSWLQETLNYGIVKGIQNKAEGTKTNILLQGRIDEVTLDPIFPRDICHSRTIETDGVVTKITYENPAWGPNVTQLWSGPFGIGEACVIPVLENDIGFNLLSGMFVISYVFGMMARYYPSTWIGLQKISQGDKILPFAHRVLDFIENKYPLQILDFLKSPYAFETPS